MTNSSNFLSGLSLQGKGLATICAFVVLQGCASTKNEVNDVMSVNGDSITPPKTTTFEPVSGPFSYNEWARENPELAKQIPELAKQIQEGINISRERENNSELFSLGLENSDRLGLITSLEYKNVGDTWGTLITTKLGDKNKSFLVTGLYKGVDFSAKATAGHLVQDFEGKNIGQSYVGAEFLKDFSEFVEGFRAGLYVNATRTDSRTLSVTEVTNQVVGGREILTTTQSFVGRNSTSAGLSMEYDINERNTFSASLGNTNLNGNGKNYSFGYTHSGDLIKPSIEYTRTDTGNFSSEKIKGQLDYIMADNFTLGAGVERINSTNLNDNRFMLTLKYVPGLKKYSDTNSFRQLDLTHVRGAEQAMTILYGNKETTVVREFIADEITAPETPTFVGSTTVTVGDSMNLVFSSVDENGLPITYRVIGTIPSGTTFNSNGTLSGTTTTVGSGSFQVVSNNGTLDSTPVTVSYNVEAAPIVNTAPTTPTVSGSTTVTIGDSMNLTFSSTDAEGNPITYRVIGTIPSGTTFNSNGTLSGTTTTVGSGSFQVVANDGELDSTPVTVSYNVEALPAQNLDIVTSGPIISGANTDTVTASNSPGTDVIFNLNINSPYTLSSTTITFLSEVAGTYTQTVNILHNGNVVGTRTLTVNWE